MSIHYSRLLAVVAVLLFPLLLGPCADAQANNGMVGVEISGVGDGSRDRMFVDLARTLRPWTSASGGSVTTNSAGWPTCDAETVLFDIRPFGAWSPPIDDPAGFQPDWSGVYAGSFRGKAAVAVVNSGAAAILDARYDPASNRTTFKIDVPRGQGLLVLSLTQTQRTPSDPVGSGFTDLRVIRPGYSPDTHQVFTRSFLKALAPFSTLRMMDVLDTNENPGYYGDAGHHALEWSMRHVPTDATQVPYKGKYGLAWEYVVDMANATGKDIWINIPIASSDDYVRRLAQFLKSSLRPGIKIYVEHSNEVWNFGFPQYIYNKLDAINEVESGHSALNNDGSQDQETWAHRRHAERLIQISNIFRSVYGDAAMMRIVRPVYASWTISLDAHFRDPLEWVSRTYGPPNKFFYAMALGHYFNAGGTAKSGSKDDILAAMRENSDQAATQYYRPFIALANSFGLQPFVYEGGSDTGGGDPANVANRIAAERDPAITGLIVHDTRDNWFALGGKLYMYFALTGSYSRYGCFGLTEDIVNTTTPKYSAIPILIKLPVK